MSRLARATAHDSGWPPNVNPWAYTAPPLHQRRGDIFGEQRAAQRRLSRRHALRERDDVGVEPEPLRHEPRPQPAESGDHLVAPEQDPVAVAQLAQPGAVPRRGRRAPAGVLHRLDHHGAHGVRALRVDRALDRGDRRVGPLGLGGGVGVVAAVGVLGMADVAQERLERRPRRRDPGQRQRAERAAVVGPAAGDDLAPQRLAAPQPVLAHQLQRRLDRLRAAGGEERAGEPLGRPAR